MNSVHQWLDAGNSSSLPGIRPIGDNSVCVYDFGTDPAILESLPGLN
jgi:hypothetical protein